MPSRWMWINRVPQREHVGMRKISGTFRRQRLVG